jgi:hypothetical protein
MNTNDRLKRPFRASNVKWRIGAVSYHDEEKKKPKSAIALPYIDARDVMERLDEVFGLEGWQCIYSHAEDKTVCEIKVLVSGVWITRAGGAGDTDIEAEKGALSDAFKRAAVLFGIGRYLYDMPTQWVDVNQYKQFAYPPLLASGCYPVVTEKQANDYIKQLTDETKTADEKREIYNQAKFDCEEAEDIKTWERIKKEIQPKKES